MNRLLVATAAAATAITLLAGCGSATSTSSSPTPNPSASTPVAPAAEKHNTADATFAQQMIPHHEQAIAMADLAATRAASPQVRDLAARIKAAQAPEIARMRGWLQAWGMTGPSASATSMPGMDHGNSSSPAMGAGSGMMSDQQMTQMAGVQGTDFDRMFLQGMIAHHTGAVAMATTELADGVNPDARQLATNIQTSQNAEIAEMRGLLTGS